MMTYDVVVLGAGMVGVSSAVHLQRRGLSVALVDRRGPGLETSYGNAGIIQREAVRPYAFPRAWSDLVGIASNRRLDVRYHPGALPRFAVPLWRYFRASAPASYEPIARDYASLIALSIETHAELARDAAAQSLLDKRGFLMILRTERARDLAFAEAQQVHQAHGVAHRLLDGAALAAIEPGIVGAHAGAVHWTDPWTVRNPGALVQAYARLFEAEGGAFFQSDADSLSRVAGAWRLDTAAHGAIGARRVVLALGPWTPRVTARFGYRPPLFVKRGYHMHYSALPGRALEHWLFDAERGYLLAPMQQGIRLTTGAELGSIEHPSTPVQLERAEQVAREIFPLGERCEDTPWRGARPCMPDMKPVIGAVPGTTDLWCAFGHGHQGFTLGPATGQLLAAMMSGAAPAIPMHPFRPDRF